jgi:hypothetical protein
MLRMYVSIYHALYSTSILQYMMPHCWRVFTVPMHRSMLVSHSESLVANNEYAALVTLRYLLMPLVVSAQGHLKA